MEAATISNETVCSTNAGLISSVERVDEFSREEEVLILKDIKKMFLRAQQGDVVALQSVTLLKHMTCGQAYSGISDQEAIQIVLDLEMPEEWKQEVIPRLLSPVLLSPVQELPAGYQKNTTLMIGQLPR